jgi:hypothetical protein
MAEILDTQRREIVCRKRLQRELSRSCRDGEAPLVSVANELDLRSFRQLAHDVVEHMRRHRCRSFALGSGRHRLDQLHVEVGRGQLQLVIARR